MTASGSLADDGRTLYVIVFNKHHADDITARVRVADRSARSARAWTVTGPSLAATNLEGPLVRETVSGREVANVAAEGFTYVFPARSLTAFEIARQ